MTSRSLVPLLAGTSLTAAVAAALWIGFGSDGHPAAAGLVAASAFVAGCLAGTRLLSKSQPEHAAANPEKPAGDAATALTAARHEVSVARGEVEALQSSVAHDLRSPMGAVLNFATVLELDHGPRLDEDAQQIVKRIRRSAESGLALLDALSRLAGVTRAPLRPTTLAVEPLLRRAYAEARPGGPRVALSVEALPPHAVADPELLRAAFLELFDNALKFSDGREKPCVSVGGRRDPDGTLVYWVTDDGVGFDMRFAGKLFGVFERLHSRDEFPGAGVGLAIVRKIAERHGGRAWVEAEPDRGARVFFALPERREAA